MASNDFLAQQFEQNRGHLRGVAYRMLGSLNEADDAVQESWLRLTRSDSSSIENLGGWLTTVVSRVCLDMLRSRQSRREDALEEGAPEPAATPKPKMDPEQEALLADSVGIALLVVLDRLNPAERLAFVLHDLFDLPFDEIAPILGRTSAAARQLASRARREVRGAPAPSHPSLSRQRTAVQSFLNALRARDMEGLVAVLHPDLLVHVDAAAGAGGKAGEVHGARNWAGQAITYARGVRFVEPMLIDGAAGLVLAPHGKVVRALRFVVVGDKIAEIEIIGDPNRLREMHFAVLPG
ncbi:MAG TPA: sigma-70 family RNA polymerase sigma factor [Acidobacteriaceae bacterium]|nr:sigma-70 family RNA polymerase sigma factor [Acidobacteriaceae bacterium]